MTDSDRPCVCGAMRIPTDELLITDTGTVHRHGGPCYVDESRSVDVVQRARQFLDGITDEPWFAEPRNEDEPYSLTTVYSTFHNGDTMDRDLVAEVAYGYAPFIAAAPTLISDLLALVEVALPTALARRDDALREVEKLRSDRDGWRAKWRDAVNHADAIAAEDAELRATLNRVRAELQFLSARDQILIRAALDEEEQG